MASDPDKSESTEFAVTNLVDVHLHQSSSINQLWTTYVVATFAGGTFAITAGNEGGVALLYAGAIGFVAFTIGHIFLIWSGLTRIKLAANDIRNLSREGGLEVIDALAKPTLRWPSMVCHVVIDICVVSAFINRIIELRTASPIFENGG